MKIDSKWMTKLVNMVLKFLGKASWKQKRDFFAVVKPIKKDGLHDLDRGMKVGILDIETTGLKADYAMLVCICIKEVNRGNMRGKTHTLRIDDFKSEKDMVRALVKLMDSFDLLMGWYSSRFDFPFINAKVIKYGLKPPIKQYRRDLCFVARANFAIRNNRLATWDDYLFGKNAKTMIKPGWLYGAIRGEKWAIDKYVYHCDIDVYETERVYKKFLPYISPKLRKGG